MTFSPSHSSPLNVNDCREIDVRRFIGHQLLMTVITRPNVGGLNGETTPARGVGGLHRGFSSVLPCRRGQSCSEMLCEKAVTNGPGLRWTSCGVAEKKRAVV